jgi:RNA polymerase-binding transcription factor DksA
LETELAMPDLKKLRKKLEDRIAELEKEARAIDSELRAPGDQDTEERAIELETEEVLEGLGNAAVAEIEQTRNALNRMDNGTYGICLVCGDDIDERRLEAVPHTPRCINCAES